MVVERLHRRRYADVGRNDLDKEVGNMKILTVDFRTKLSDQTTQYGRKEFGQVPPEQVMRL